MRILPLMVIAALAAGCSPKHASFADAAAAPASGQPDGTPQPVSTASLEGDWQGSADGVSFQLIVQPNGAYSEIQTASSTMLQQSGVIQPAAPGEITFVVQDWSPKTQDVYHPTGAVGGYDTPAPVAKPVGGVWKVQFTSPNSFSLQDAKLGGVIIFTRVS